MYQIRKTENQKGIIHSFIHIEHLYSASSRELLKQLVKVSLTYVHVCMHSCMSEWNVWWDQDSFTVCRVLLKRMVRMTVILIGMSTCLHYFVPLCTLFALLCTTSVAYYWLLMYVLVYSFPW